MYHDSVTSVRERGQFLLLFLLYDDSRTATCRPQLSIRTSIDKAGNLSEDERLAIYRELLAKSRKDQLVYGSSSVFVNKYDVHHTTISSIRKCFSASKSYLGAVHAVKIF